MEYAFPTSSARHDATTLDEDRDAMMNGAERESFALQVMEEVRRWPGVEMHPHPSPTAPGTTDGIEFRLYGRQIGHMHEDCAVHLALTKALKASVVSEQLAEPLDVAPRSGWTMFNPMSSSDAQHAIWLLRLNYVRLRRQRMTPTAAASSELLQKHEAALAPLSPTVEQVLRKTQARSRLRPLPTFDTDGPSSPVLEI
jgi:hypothetical protein